MDWLAEPVLIIERYGWRYLDGLYITVELVALASAIGFVLAVPLSLARVSYAPWFRWPAYGYVYVFRGTPLLIQLFLIYYGVSQFDVVRGGPLWPILSSAWWCGLIALTLNTTAYIAEILRGGIEAVPRGEVEAARAVGMSTAQMYRRVVFPRAIRIAWPAYANEVVLLLKASALVSTITLFDIMGETRTIYARNFSMWDYFYAAVLYLALTATLTRVFRWAEARLNRYLGPRPAPAQRQDPLPGIRA